jgi:hypothetical protein
LRFRFSNHYRHDYKTIGVHGFNVWENNPACSLFNQKANKNASCSGFDAAEGCTLKFMSREAACKSILTLVSPIFPITD